MKRISYPGGSLTTGDAIADAVLDLAAALANAGRALRVDVPVLGVDDQRSEVSLVIGPASQLACEPTWRALDVIDDVFVAHTRELIRHLTEVMPLPFLATQDPGEFT